MGRVVDDSDFDAALKEVSGMEASSTATQKFFFFFVSVLMSALPVYIFTTPLFDLNVETELSFVVGATVVSAVMLFIAYTTHAHNVVISLLKKREATLIGKGKFGDARKDLVAATSSECAAYSMFINNVIYLGLFLVTAFSVIPRFPGTPLGIAYAVSVITPATMVLVIRKRLF